MKNWVKDNWQAAPGVYVWTRGHPRVVVLNGTRRGILWAQEDADSVASLLWNCVHVTDHVYYESLQAALSAHPTGELARLLALF